MTKPIEVVAIIETNTISSIVILLVRCELDMLFTPIDSSTASVRQIGRRRVIAKGSQMRKITSGVRILNSIYISSELHNEGAA